MAFEAFWDTTGAGLRTEDGRRRTEFSRPEIGGGGRSKPRYGLEDKAGMTSQIQGFEELQVYREACALDYAIFTVSQSFPREEIYSLTDQIRRSSRSIGGNIAESWAKRRYPAHFISKLTDADGELQETKHWIGRAQVYGYLSPDVEIALLERCRIIGRKLGTMIAHPHGFCP